MRRLRRAALLLRLPAARPSVAAALWTQARTRAGAQTGWQASDGEAVGVCDAPGRQAAERQQMVGLAMRWEEVVLERVPAGPRALCHFL
eukprot:scaffold253665_cov12-Tisochrysis_lutea.AAC.1